MNKEHAHIQLYFCASKLYFWQWAEEGQIIEWYNGGPTLCYRDDLIGLLKELAPQGLPPLGAILLVLSACKDGAERFTINNGDMHRIILIMQKAGYAEVKELIQLTGKVTELIQMIAALPMEYRTGTNRVLLLQTIFEHVPGIPEKEARPLISMLDSGQYDEVIQRGIQDSPVNHFREDLEALRPAINTFTSTAQLLQRLRTGLTVLPQPATLPAPEATPEDLLAELAEDPRTAGLTRLTRRMIAALKIPMHTQGSSDQSFGGVSDITNRGNFDRLLLSELAYDDISLMARLANNEALYLRREELPSKRNREWIILMDTTIRMWGVPRVFALSAALACTRNSKAPTNIEGYTLSGNDSKPMSLSTKASIIRALEQQAPALNCAAALSAFLQQPSAGGDTVSFLITCEQSLSDPDFVKALTEARQAPGFLITVNRNGSMHYYELIKGRKKLLNAASFDLEELLFQAPENKVSGEQPAVLHCNPFPFRFPATKIRPSIETVLDTGDKGVLCITEDRRVLYWPSPKAGALEIIPGIEQGTTHLGYDKLKKTNLCILVHKTVDKKISVYNIQLTDLSFTRMNVDLEIREEEKGEILFDTSYFYLLRNKSKIAIIHVEKGLVNNEGQLSGMQLEVISQANILQDHVRSRINKHINNGYAILSNISGISVSPDNCLVIDTWKLTQDHDGRIKLKPLKTNMLSGTSKQCEQQGAFPPFPNKSVHFRTYKWADGSEAIVDTRGFIHLKSHDKSIPEISFVLVLEKYTACWAADGKTCGNQYFLDATANENGFTFYKNYIQRFIDALR